ncbi:neuroglian-like isoform X2 [Mytilus californianus]|uniref:neuroglian-like isoform X2 n=1 Tax=Mytilus californianus TaxID=6549 RepID=UPI002245BF90|nr:neuroglian-like isoform X2 [Mytilus californianus]
MKFLLICLVFTATIVTVSSVPNRPPAVYIQPPFDVYYKTGETVEMQCVADGVPTPIYRWTRNKVEFNPSGNNDRVVQLFDSGTMVFNRPEDKDEGIFQCNAINEHGTSTTINVNLREAMLEPFPYGEDTVRTVIRGHSVKLPCIPPTSIPKAEIRWVLKDTKPGGRIEAINFNSRITMDLEGNLYITAVQQADFQNGRSYVCMAINYFMRKNTYAPGIVIKPVGSSGTDETVPPHYLWATPSESFGLLGESIRIKCIYGGNPYPEVHWESNTGAIPSNRRTLSQGGQELLISQLREEDRGQYICFTTSSSGQREQRNINVILKSKPYWAEGGEPKDIETSIGASATFYCNASGDPQPKLNWYINGVRLKDSKHPTVKSARFLKPDDHNITIINLEKSDVMVIQCNASNIYGYVYADFYLNVLKEKPQFIKRPVKELKVAETTNVYLTCQTSGKPDPIVTWYKGTQQITGGRYQIQTNGDLFISNIVLSDAGNFTCVAENAEGSATDWGVLIVRRKTRIEQKPGDLENTANTDAKFTCSGTTDFEEVANLRVYWLKDGKEITTNDQRMTTNVQDNSLTISGTISRDSGLYTCVVTNGLDQETASAILTVKDKPEPPVDVETKDCINKKVTLRWTKGAFNNAPIQYFTIQYNTSIEPDNWAFAATANQSHNSMTLSLQPGVSYSWRLLATNKIGISDPSQHSDICVTDKAAPYKNPENVRGLGDKPNYLVIEWVAMPPIEHGGENFRYVISINRRGNNPYDNSKTISNWRDDRFELLTNDIYVPYNVTIKAVNSDGDSSAPLIVHTIYSGESKPDSSLRVDGFVVDNTAMEDNSAKFYWNWDMDLNNNLQSGLNGKFRGFKIQYWVKDMKKKTFREDEVLEKDLKSRYGTRKRRSVTELMYTVQDLLPYTYMEAQICVMNTHYVSGPSAIVSFVTARGVPGPVENLRALVVGTNFVELTWNKPELLNSPISVITNSYLQGYDVGFQTVSGLDLGKMQEMDPQIVDPRRNTTVLNGLTANKKYRIYMWGRTENGRGEASFVELTTAKTASMSVPAFSIINVNSTFFNVTWTTIANKKYGTVAFVEYRKEGVADWQQSSQEVSKSWIGIANLQSGTSYEMRLSVTNGGNTASSDIEVVKTKGIPAAFSLGANFGWFIGLIISVLLIIALSVLIYLLYKRRPEPQKQRPYTAPPRRRHDGYGDDRSTQDIVHKSSGSLNKGYDNYNYSDREYHDDDDGGFNRDEDYKRGYYDDEKRKGDDDYDRQRDDDYDKGYDGDRYDDYNRRHDDSYDDYRDDDYNRRRDDDDDRRRDDDYDRRRDDDYNDRGRYDDKDRHYDDDYEDDKRRYSDHSDRDRYGDDDRDYEPYSRRPDYDRTPSYDNRPPSYGEEVDIREPNKFDADGYPIETKPSTPKTPGTSSFV